MNDLPDELVEGKTSVLCEVYDGQYCGIIVKSEEGYPLTRLQLCQQHFKNKMRKLK